jgi:hypothetical protein
MVSVGVKEKIHVYAALSHRTVRCHVSASRAGAHELRKQPIYHHVAAQSHAQKAFLQSSEQCYTDEMGRDTQHARVKRKLRSVGKPGRMRSMGKSKVEKKRQLSGTKGS